MSAVLGGTAQQLADQRRRLHDAVDVQAEAAEKRQHAVGKQTARERIAGLLDPGSFVELDALVQHHSVAFGIDQRHPAGDGVVTGYGSVDGRTVCVYAQDFTVFGGSVGEEHGRKITKVQDMALRVGAPIIGILDGGGARIQEGVDGLTQFAEIFRRNVASSGVIPQISLICGPCAGGATYSPALTDFVVMVHGSSHMFITGPDVVSAVTGEQVGFEELGGATTHAERSGVAHFVAPDESSAVELVKVLLSYLPSNNLTDPPVFDATMGLELTDADRALDWVVPDDDTVGYDMGVVVRTVMDDGDFLETQSSYAANVITGFGRVDGRSVGVIANQPMTMAGALDIAAAEKAARFVRTCDAFAIPVVTFVDVPGFLPGTDQEWNGIIRRGAKLIYAYAEATVPLVTVIVRKAYGGAYIVMGSKQLGADVNLAWPTAQIAVMGAAGAVSILGRRTLANMPEAERTAERSRLIEDYEKTLINPYEAAGRGFIDAVIQPSDTRGQVALALRALRTKRADAVARKHGNIPL